MGTSASSNGPVGGVPFDPPWLDDIAQPQPDDGVQPEDQGDGDGDSGSPPSEQPLEPQTKPPELAPPARFGNARRKLGDFARTGNQDAFRKAVGHYSRTGMGGARNAANRMRTSTRSAANLFGVLQLAREGSDPAINEWVTSLTSQNAGARDIADEIIRRVAPSGGTLDETSCRDSMAQAMQDLMFENPDVDLLHLDDDAIWTLIESFLGYEAFNRMCLDIGQIFESSQISIQDRSRRTREMQEYLDSEIFAQVERLRQTTPHASSNQLQAILQKALQNTFLVYEGSL